MSGLKSQGPLQFILLANHIAQILEINQNLGESLSTPVLDL